MSKEISLFHRCWGSTRYKEDSVLDRGLQTLTPELINANTNIHFPNAEPSCKAAGCYPAPHAEPAAIIPPYQLTG